MPKAGGGAAGAGTKRKESPWQTGGEKLLRGGEGRGAGQGDGACCAARDRRQTPRSSCGAGLAATLATGSPRLNAPKKRQRREEGWRGGGPREACDA